jgi:hypothetical protein
LCSACRHHEASRFRCNNCRYPPTTATLSNYRSAFADARAALRMIREVVAQHAPPHLVFIARPGAWSATGSRIPGLSFSGLLTLVEIGHMVMVRSGTALEKNARWRQKGWDPSLKWTKEQFAEFCAKMTAAK